VTKFLILFVLAVFTTGAAAVLPVVLPAMAAMPHAAETALAPRLGVPADWQYPDGLPERFRNHCSTEFFTGRAYCADHCGSGYQFFYCSEGSFGCCHLGRGYCDFHGLMRCSP
jgi:hypothetical protein